MNLVHPDDGLPIEGVSVPQRQRAAADFFVKITKRCLIMI